MTKRSAAGALAWIATIQFFAAQAVVQSAWTTPFSLTRNFISDLGNTACAPFPAGSESYVCSPWHALMNGSFVLTGLVIVIGALLLRPALETGRLGDAGLALVGLGGAGFILVGCYPENVDMGPHRTGAALHFVAGNLGLVVLGLAMWAGRRRRAIGAGAVTAGVLGLAATALFVQGRFLGLGIGGMERLAAYPLPLALATLGSFLAAMTRPTRSRSPL